MDRGGVKELNNKDIFMTCWISFWSICETYHVLCVKLQLSVQVSSSQKKSEDINTDYGVNRKTDKTMEIDKTI